jgi:hypothetical protein
VKERVKDGSVRSLCTVALCAGDCYGQQQNVSWDSTILHIMQFGAMLMVHMTVQVTEM